MLCLVRIRLSFSGACLSKPPEKEISKEISYDQCLIPDRCGPMVDYKDHRENYCMQLKCLKLRISILLW